MVLDNGIDTNPKGPHILLEVVSSKGKLYVAGKLVKFGKRDTKDQKVLRAFIARLAEVVEEFDSKKE